MLETPKAGPSPEAREARGRAWPAPVRGVRGLIARAGRLLAPHLLWHRLPLPLGLVDLVRIRRRLERRNLHDTGAVPTAPADPPPPWRPEYAVGRAPDGTHNDQGQPRMGACGARFGRNVPLAGLQAPARADLVRPSPREISRRLLTRHEFQPAEKLNLLAAAWVQFEVHDWFSHGAPDDAHPIEIPLDPADPWPERPMRVGRTRRDPTRPALGDGGPPTYVNRVTHWWDASQIYGSDADTVARLRTRADGSLAPDGKLALAGGDELPIDPTGMPITGHTENWWIGLHLLHTLFAREHNAICDRLRRDYPRWSGDQLFARARLVNAALIAKIHTLEWADAILGHPTMQEALRANWWGLAGERIERTFGRLGRGQLLSGLPGSPRDHHGVPYSITEEFAAVYRMHPLLPDQVRLRSAESGAPLAVGPRELSDLVGRRATGVARRFGLADLFYSFGVARAGKLALHNYPRALQQHRRDDGALIDVAAIDLLRDRERSVPRYNALRRALGLPPVADFDQLCDDPVWAADIRDLYGGDIEAVDLLVGLLAERPPEGFGLSDTAFRIFLLMASRRLESDRFFTDDFTPEVYTPAGMAWIDENRMATVLVRHLPELAAPLRAVDNPFSPWPRPGG
jgi:hypothetical protein